MDPMRRRQSILKPDGEPTPTKTFGKNKRISFSGKNSVKEFLVDNEKHTVWGTSYEKEMEAHQKAGDSTAPSQMDISGVTSMMMYESVPSSNKENINVNVAPPRCSFAMLDGEDTRDERHLERTRLHALPCENFSNDKVEEIFQIKSFIEKRPMEMPPPAAPAASHTIMNETAMEVSMMWQDIMSQTKEATNKIPMGNTINIISDPEMSRRTTVLRTRETIYDGVMDVSSVQQPQQQRTGVIVSQSNRQTVYYDRNVDAQMEESIVANHHRQTIHFNAEDCQLDESIVVPDLGKPPSTTTRQTIHFNNAPIEDDDASVLVIAGGVDKENVPVTIPRARETVYYTPQEGDMEVSHRQVIASSNKNRGTIYFPANAAQMDESLVAGGVAAATAQKENTPAMGAVPKQPRPTIHYAADEAQMDETLGEQHKTTIAETVRQTSKNKSSRQTIVFGGENAALEESLVVQAKGVAEDRGVVVVQQPIAMETRRMGGNSRQTIHFNDGEGGEMDESVRGQPPQPVARMQTRSQRAARQTIHFNGNEGEMDESTVQVNISVNPNGRPAMKNSTVEAVERATASRRTIHYGQQEGRMDETLANQVSRTTRQSIYFNGQEGGEMEESMVAAPPQIDSRPSIVAGVMKPTATRQTILFNRDDEGKMEESLMVDRQQQQQVVDDEDDYAMEVEEGPQKTPGKRGTIFYAAQDGEMEETRCGGGFLVPQSKQPEEVKRKMRQTVYYNGETEEGEGRMEESMVVGGMTPQRGTGEEREQEGNCNVMPNVANLRKPRQTIHFNDRQNDGAMDETMVAGRGEVAEQKAAGPLMGGNKQRQTVYERREMEMSMVTGEGVPMKSGPVDQPPPARRQTVYYQDENAMLDMSSVEKTEMKIMKTKKQMTENPSATTAINRRGTIHFNHDDGGMDESIVIAMTPKGNAVTVENKINVPRQTINFKEQAEGQADLEETLRVGAMQKTLERMMGPLEMSLRMRQGANQSAVENLSMGGRRRNLEQKQDNDAMEESIQIPRPREEVARVERVNDEGPFKRYRETVYKPSAMDETLRKKAVEQQQERMSMRRGTFNVPPEESRLHQTATVQGLNDKSERNNTGNATEIEMDSMVLDLNNSEDSIELLDSQDVARPMNSTGRMSLVSPFVAPEEVYDLNLNFNVTGQLKGNKMMGDEEEEEVEEVEGPKGVSVNVTRGLEDGQEMANNSTKTEIVTAKTITKAPKGGSLIPVARGLPRTPRNVNKSVGARVQHSPVDSVCRDAPGGAMMMMPRGFSMGLGGGGENDAEMTYIGGMGQKKGGEVRQSIPAFEATRAAEETKMQTMLEMGELSEDEVQEEEEEQEQARPDTPPYCQLNVEMFERMDFEFAKKELQMLRYKVDRVTNWTPMEESVFVMDKTTTDYPSLRENIWREIKEKTDEAIGKMDDGINWGYFPLCLPMEDMIRNLVESEHKRWIYQDLYYHVGLMKFTHRLIKTFQVAIRFEVDDPEFEREHYLPFKRFDVLELDLSRCCEVDKQMHKELMRQMPVGLTSLYGSSVELGRFLGDVNGICERIFRDMATTKMRGA